MYAVRYTKKNRVRRFIASVLAVISIGVVSCDNEPYDSSLEGEQGVGKAVVTIYNQGETILLRDGVVGTVDKTGVLELKIKIRGSENFENDSLTIRALRFQEGNFPTNANESNYYSWENKLLYTTIDEDRPDLVTGIVAINSINRKARVLTGTFDIKRMMPVNQDDPNLKAFPISGSFENVAFMRKEATYVEAFVNEVALANPLESAEIREGNIAITSVDEVERTQQLVVSFPDNDEVKVSNDPATFKPLGWFKVDYTSVHGVKYTSDGIEGSEGHIRFDYSKVIEEDGKQMRYLKGRFEATLAGVDNSKERVKITYGDFSVKIAMP